MPAESKGRKKGRNRERRRDGGRVPVAAGGGGVAEEPSPVTHEAGAVQAGMAEPRMPSPFARATGALLATMTAFVAVFMISNGLSDDNAGAAIARLAAGAGLVVLALVVGVLSVAPEAVLAFFRRRRGG